MRKFFKVAIVAFLVIALGVGGTIFYFMKMKTYDVADKKVDEILEKDYDVQLPPGAPGADGEQPTADGTVEGGHAEGSVTATNGQTVDGKPASGQTASGQSADGTSTAGQTANGQAAAPTSEGGKSNDSTSGTKNSSSPSSNGSSKVTVESIKERYRPSFNNLQAQAESNVNSVVSRAASEYAQKRANGEAVNPAYFYQKYYGAASQLEAKTDAAFNTIYGSLQAELKSNGYSASHANEFKQQYESAKASREAALMNKVKGAL